MSQAVTSVGNETVQVSTSSFSIQSEVLLDVISVLKKWFYKNTVLGSKLNFDISNKLVYYVDERGVIKINIKESFISVYGKPFPVFALSQDVVKKIEKRAELSKFISFSLLDDNKVNIDFYNNDDLISGSYIVPLTDHVLLPDLDKINFEYCDDINMEVVKRVFSRAELEEEMAYNPLSSNIVLFQDRGDRNKYMIVAGSPKSVVVALDKDFNKIDKVFYMSADVPKNINLSDLKLGFSQEKNEIQFENERFSFYAVISLDNAGKADNVGLTVLSFINNRKNVFKFSSNDETVGILKAIRSACGSKSCSGNMISIQLDKQYDTYSEFLLSDIYSQMQINEFVTGLYEDEFNGKMTVNISPIVFDSFLKFVNDNPDRVYSMSVCYQDNTLRAMLLGESVDADYKFFAILSAMAT